MAGLVPAIHVFLRRDCKDVDAGTRPGMTRMDVKYVSRSSATFPPDDQNRHLVLPAPEQSAYHAANQPTWTATAAVVRSTSALMTGRTVAIGFVAATDAGVCHRDGLGE